METVTVSNEQTEEAPARDKLWHPIDNFRNNQRLSALDYAVREHVKKQLTGHLSFHMETLVKKGLTYEELLEIQRELELCPSVLEYYPGKQSWLARLWQKLSFSLGLF